jgi:hypothetical protein
MKSTSWPKRASAFAVFAGPPPTTGPVGKISIKTSPHTQILTAALPYVLKTLLTLQHLTNGPAPEATR